MGVLVVLNAKVRLRRQLREIKQIGDHFVGKVLLIRIFDGVPLRGHSLLEFFGNSINEFLLDSLLHLFIELF